MKSFRGVLGQGYHMPIQALSHQIPLQRRRGKSLALGIMDLCVLSLGIAKVSLAPHSPKACSWAPKPLTESQQDLDHMRHEQPPLVLLTSQSGGICTELEMLGLQGPVPAAFCLQTASTQLGGQAHKDMVLAPRMMPSFLL